MKEETIDIEKLIQDQHNFNKGTAAGQELLEKSFRELGAGRSLLVDKDGNIIAGNKSQQAAIAAGIKKVRVIESDGTELIAVKRTDIDIDSAKGRKMALADNLVTQVNLAWDEIEIEKVQYDTEGFDVDDWGLKIESQNVSETKVEDDDFDEKSDKVTTICKLGDIYQLGNHRLMCGDSTSDSDMGRLMKGEKAQLWLTDPPYNVNVSNSQGDKILNDNLSNGAFLNFLTAAFRCAEKVMEDGCPFYIWYASREHINFETAVINAGMRVRQQLIWNKNSFILGRSHYQWKHEPCLYGWKGDTCRYFTDSRRETTVINENKPAKDAEHPTMKPVRLFGYQMANSTKINDVVLDSFGGSGTTIIAAEQLNRKARVMELDPHYCDAIIARWEKFTNSKAIKI